MQIMLIEGQCQRRCPFAAGARRDQRGQRLFAAAGGQQCIGTQDLDQFHI
jgi:hypothetical protein